MALGDDVRRLQKIVTTLSERVGNLRRGVNQVRTYHAETARLAADMRREFERDIALLKRDIEELKSWKVDQKRAGEEQSRRLWAFGPNLVSAVIGGLIAAAIAYFIPRH